MTIKSMNNIFFYLLIIGFMLLFFVQIKNSNDLISLEVIFKNNEYQYVNISEVHNKIKMHVKEKQSANSVKDINTRLLEDSLGSLSYVKNAEVYLSMNKLSVFLQQETPFIRTIIDGDTCVFNKDSVRLDLVDMKLPKVLFFIDDISLQSWDETFYLTNYIYNSSFLSSIVSEVSYNKDYDYILHSDLFDFKINIGSISNLDEKVDKMKLFSATISKEERLNNDSILIKELNVKYDDQIICVN